MFKVGDKVRIIKDARGKDRLIKGQYEVGTVARINSTVDTWRYQVQMSSTYSVLCCSSMLENAVGE